MTSAETVLIQEQSYRRLLDKIDSNRVSDNKLIIVVAISPNSRASIAHFLDMDASECFLRIASVLKSLGVTYVVDAAAAGDVALMEAREEFVKRCPLPANAASSVQCFYSLTSLSLLHITSPHLYQIRARAQQGVGEAGLHRSCILDVHRRVWGHRGYRCHASTRGTRSAPAHPAPRAQLPLPWVGVLRGEEPATSHPLPQHGEECPADHGHGR